MKAKEEASQLGALQVDWLTSQELIRLTLGSDGWFLSEGEDAPSKKVPSAVTNRHRQLLESLLKRIDWDTLDRDVETLQDLLQLLINRRNEDEASAALNRVIELLEELVDTAESCELKK